MKKKIQKPLKLNRETLASLNHGDLREPAGMAVRPSIGCTTATVSTCAVINTQCVGY